MNRKPNIEAVVLLAAQKSEQTRQRTREAIQSLQQQGKPINFSTVCEAANVSKTFLYDPRHADLAEEIRRLREVPIQRPPTVQAPHGKSEHAKDAQIARLKERVHQLEQKVNVLQQENELLYGKLAGQPADM
jgi:DNA invertase Pin-like site-specific DNA recombinase